MCDTWKETWTFNAFASLLSDAIAFDIQAQNVDSQDFTTVNRYAKASFINAAFSIESAANACIARLPYPKIAIDQIDRATVIDKFDILYQVNSRKKVDRGCKPFQCVNEIIALRNGYVHPKLDKVQLNINQAEDKDRTYERPEEHTKKTRFLKIPKKLDIWAGKESRVVVKETISFLNHFFIELCCLAPEKCSDLLAIYTKGPNHTATFLARHERELFEKAQGEYKMEIKFLVF